MAKEIEKAKKVAKKEARKSKKGKELVPVFASNWSKKEGKEELAALFGESAASEILALKSGGLSPHIVTPKNEPSSLRPTSSPIQSPASNSEELPNLIFPEIFVTLESYIATVTEMCNRCVKNDENLKDPSLIHSD
jgi:hypothetical protein